LSKSSFTFTPDAVMQVILDSSRHQLSKSSFTFTPDAVMQASLRFYNPALHTAAFALPEFARRKLEEARVRGGFPPRDTSALAPATRKP
jgi:spermidine synthase